MSEVPLYLEAQVLRRIVKRFQGGIVFKSHTRVCHSTLGSRVIQREGSTLAHIPGQATVRDAAMMR